MYHFFKLLRFYADKDCKTKFHILNSQSIIKNENNKVQISFYNKNVTKKLPRKKNNFNFLQKYLTRLSTCVLNYL